MSEQLSADEVIQIIAKKEEKTTSEVEEMVKETMAALNNFINRQGAAYLLASNLGIQLTKSVSKTKLIKIEEIIPGIDSVTVVGRVKRIFPVKEFTKDGQKSYLRKIILIDSSGEITAILWGAKVHSIKELEIETGTIIRISNAFAKENQYSGQKELSIGNQTTIDINVIGIDTAEYPEVHTNSYDIKNIPQSHEPITVIGKIISKRELKTFAKEKGEGKVSGITIQDLTGKINVTFWNEETELLEKFELGGIVKLTDLKTKLNNEILELVFQYYSTITKEQKTELQSIQVLSKNKNELRWLKISQIDNQQYNIGILGKIAEISEVKNFESENSYQSLLLFDETGAIAVKFWNDKKQLLSNIKQSDVIKLAHVNARFNNYAGKFELNSTSDTTITEEFVEKKQLKNLKPQLTRISDIENITSSISMKLYIKRIYEVREIIKEDNTTSKVLNYDVIDENGQMGQLAAWNEDIIKLKEFNEEDVILVYFARAKKDEYSTKMTIGKSTNIQKTSEYNKSNFEIKMEKSIRPEKITKINEMVVGPEIWEIKATIVDVYQTLVIYDSCNKCSRKILRAADGTEICQIHGNQDSITKRMIITCIISDETGTLSTKFFGENAEELAQTTALEVHELNEKMNDDGAAIQKFKERILQREIHAVGKLKTDMNDEPVFNVSEFYE